MDRIGYAAYWLVAAVVRMLPLALSFRLGQGLGALAYLAAAPYRRLVMRNLRIAFPEKPAAARRRLARQHFTTLGANLLASMKLPSLTREKVEQLVTIEGLDVMHESVIGKHGFVFVISHIGNWELFAQLTPIIFRLKVGTIFQRLGNPYLDAAIRRDRARLGLELFERKEGFAAAARFLREKGGVGVLIDQHAGDAGLWCPFFGRLASTTTMPAMLALRADAFIVPAAVYTDGVARWRVVIGKPEMPTTRDVRALTVQLNLMLEAQIRVQPQDWFWVHNRWKTPRPKFLLATYKRGVHGEGVRQPFRLVIRSTNWLGDAVMSVPAVRVIKRSRADLHLTILTPAKLADVWRRVAEVDEVLTIEPDENIFAVARKLRAGAFDSAIIFPNSLRTALEAWLAKIPRRVGYPGHRRRWLLDQPLIAKKKKRAEPPQHQVHHYLELARFAGAEVPADAADFPSRARERQLPGGAPVIGVCPGAEYGPAKRWMPDRFAEVMTAVSRETGAVWKVFGVAKDRAIADAIIAVAKVPIDDRVAKTTLSQLVDELAACDLLLTNDTGTMHLAALLGVPTVSVFGSTEPALTGPLGPAHHVIRRHVACSPCFLRECPLDFRCMEAITVGEVTAAVRSALGALAR